jgi:uncharacterized membrane protein YphA (DoxX/SURF4 family)
MTSARKRPVTRPPGPVRTGDSHSSGGGTPQGRLATTVTRLGNLTAGWGPTVGRILLGLVLAWFGYHELVQPILWTGYVPGVHTASGAAVALVLAHGWVLLILAVALVAGIAPRAAAALAVVLLAEIVIWLWASGGLSDLTLRDVGVLGLAACIAGRTEQRFSLTG